MTDTGLSQPEEDNVKQAKALIEKYTVVPSSLHTRFPNKNRFAIFLFDSVLYRLYNSVTCTPIEGDTPLYRITVVVPGRTYSFVLTPLNAYIVGRLVHTMSMYGVRKHLCAGGDTTENNAAYIPSWAYDKLLACASKICNEHDPLIRFQNEAIGDLLVPKNNEDAKPLLH